MELIPFSFINQYIKERLVHPSRYTHKQFSFLKIFQHGLSFSLTKQQQKIIKNYLNFPYAFQLFVYYLKSLRRAKAVSYKLKEFVILDPGRLVMGADNKWHSIYFDKISNEIGSERLTKINLKKNAEIACDYDITYFNRELPYLDASEKTMLKEILQTLKQAKDSKQFTPDEYAQIVSAMHIFYEEFRFYYHLFQGQPTKCLIFICHYHNEGLIAALKMLHIQCVEIQHGLIAGNDLYFAYHEQFTSVIKKAFFPDKILVYGPYWKRILETGCEYRSYQIHVVGDYLYRISNLKLDNTKKENIVVVCAQKNLHQDYVNYGKSLAKHLKKHPDWRGVVKLHPLEKNKAAYEELKAYGIEIVDVDTPLDVLLSKCKVQVSIYSTTFYDALGFNVINFSLQDFGSMSDYASDMIAEGVAAPITADEDPIEKFIAMTQADYNFLPREDVYAPFNDGVLKDAIAFG